MDGKKIKKLVIALILVILAGLAYLFLLRYSDKQKEAESQKEQEEAKLPANCPSGHPAAVERVHRLLHNRILSVFLREWVEKRELARLPLFVQSQK